MFYEGSEKRLEITSTLNLLEFSHHFWQEMVSKAGAYIISQIESDSLKAFLLSESSLFVWKNRLLLITCGETHLVQAALYFQNKITRNDITSLLFQRHQANYPERQKSNFQQDKRLLQTQLQGDCQHWSESYCGDLFLFGNNQHPFATKNILMMHDLSGRFFSALQQGGLQEQEVAAQLQLSKHFHHFTIDQHCFEPQGYSLNAISGQNYFTLHITPETQSSYLSFESNLPNNEIASFQHHLMTLFSAQRNYLMCFSYVQQTLAIHTEQLEGLMFKPENAINTIS